MEIFLAHLVGDYLLQFDWMALRKKTSSLVCLAHVLAYLAPFLLVGLSWPQLVLIGAQHFAQDRTGFVVWFMRATGHQGFSQPPFAPWSVILTDNILHGLWIGAVVWAGPWLA